MTSQQIKKQESNIWILRAVEGFADTFAGLPLRILLAGAVTVFALLWCLEQALTSFVPAVADTLASHLSATMEVGELTEFTTLKLIQQNDLSWLYITDSGDGQVLPSTRPFAPSLRKIDNQSREVNFQGDVYYEAVKPLQGGKYLLHLGVPKKDSSILEVFKTPSTALVAPVRAAYVVLPLFSLVGICAILTYVFVSIPMRELSRTLYTAQTRRGLLGIFEPSEIKSVRKALEAGSRVMAPKDAEVVSASKSSDKWRTPKSHKTGEMTRTMMDSQELRSVAPVEEDSRRVDPLLLALRHELRRAPSVKNFGHILLKGLSELYPDAAGHAVLIGINKDGDSRVESSVGIDDVVLRLLQDVDHYGVAKAFFQTAKFADIGPLSLRRHGFGLLADSKNVRRVLYFNCKYQGKLMAIVGLFLKSEDAFTPQQAQGLERFIETVGSSYYEVFMKQEAEEAQWTDQLTGLRNRQFFQELMDYALQRARANPAMQRFSVMYIAADQLEQIAETRGPDLRDRLLQELSNALRSCIRVKSTLDADSKPDYFLVRYSSDEFVLVMEASDVEQVSQVAKRVKQAVEQTQTAAEHLTVSIGHATYRGGSDNVDSVLQSARLALSYAMEKMRGATICDASQVPSGFTPQRKASVMKGELGVLDSAGLLQSIANSLKSGLLTVEDALGRQFLLSWEDGRPLYARLGKLSGLSAVIEFITSFSSGKFDFRQQIGTSDSQVLFIYGERLPSVHKCLMDAALSEDNMTAARVRITTTEVLVRATPGDEAHQRWSQLKVSMIEEWTPAEFEIMEVMLQRSSGGLTLTQLFEQLETVHTGLKWRGAALLLECELLQVRPIGT